MVGYRCTRATLFRISGTAGEDALKLGVWLEDHQLCALHRMGDLRKNARVTVLTFKHICSLPLVHRPKGVLLVASYRNNARGVAILFKGVKVVFSKTKV